AAPALGQQREGPRAVTRTAPPPATNAAPPPAPPPQLENLPPYEPQLMRLSEIMGALAYLRDLCGAKDGAVWSARMNALLDAEASGETRRERLAGAFNRGFRGYQVTYRTCTANAQTAMERFVTEGGRLSHDITGKFGGG
ncbi:MAG: hypothetical protein JWN07_3262, partial [Hyphomicrobiales bacterium]|nr:hypothetical protein [Hyphomicrobiales bacterium]